jgi:hypothetical protein
MAHPFARQVNVSMIRDVISLLLYFFFVQPDLNEK